jgi:hypothetical protein
MKVHVFWCSCVVSHVHVALTHVKDYWNWLRDTLEITDDEEWKYVSRAQIAALRGSYFVNREGGVLQVLNKYPKIENAKRYQLGCKKGENFLVRTLRKLSLPAPTLCT